MIDIKDLLYIRGHGRKGCNNILHKSELKNYIKYYIGPQILHKVHQYDPGPLPDLVTLSGEDHVWAWGEPVTLIGLYRHIQKGNIKTNPGKSVLLTGGSDMRLKWFNDIQPSKTFRTFDVQQSVQPFLWRKLKDHFAAIYYEGKDVECEYINLLPNCLNRQYMDLNTDNGKVNIHNYINNIEPKDKTRLVGTSFGLQHLKSNFTKQPDYRYTKERQQLDKYMQTPACKIEGCFTEFTDYYKELSKFKYFVSPNGNGAQCTKTYEAILANTIPIMIRTIQALELKYKYNFPIIILEDWNDLDYEKLEHEYIETYNKINWNKLKHTFTVKGFVEQYLKSK